MATQEDVFKKIVSHAKEYGFVFQSSEIYDGLSAVYDYGQNGVELKNNIKRYWWDSAAVGGSIVDYNDLVFLIDILIDQREQTAFQIFFRVVNGNYYADFGFIIIHKNHITFYCSAN